DRRLLKLEPGGFETTGELAGDERNHAPRALGCARSLFETVSERAAGREGHRVLLADIVFGDHARATRLRQLRQVSQYCALPLLPDDQGRKVGLREVAIVVRLLF